MAWDKRVVWSEGMMLQPQHFQQQTRYHEAQLRDTLNATSLDNWGINSLHIDNSLLKTGKFSVSKASGILKDGSVFDLPERDHAPASIDVPKDTLGQIIYLAVPILRQNQDELKRSQDKQARFGLDELEARDASGLSNTKALLEVSGLSFSLRTSAQDNSEFSCIAIAKISDVSPNGIVSLSEDFIAPSINIKNNILLSGFLSELKKLISHRIHSLASRVSVAGKSTGNEIVDYMMLQALNRHSPTVQYLDKAEHVSAFYLYEKLCMLIGELSTFVKADKLVAELPHFQQGYLHKTFLPIIEELRSLFSVVLEQNSINIPLQERKFGIRVGTVADKTLFNNASFILAVSADVPSEEIMQYFASQTKIGAVESIKELVNLQLPGIQLAHLPAAPREVPYQRGFVYFELVQSGEYWQALTQSGGLACHISVDFPNLQVELWAVRA